MLRFSSGALLCLVACGGQISGGIDRGNDGPSGPGPGGVDAPIGPRVDAPIGPGPGVDAPIGISLPDAAPNLRPIISRFSASPPSLPAGGGSVTLSWQADRADSLTIDPDIGAVTGSSRTTSVTATTVFTLTARNDQGAVTASTAVVVGANPSTSGNRYVAMVAPVSGESFTAPTSLRLIAAGKDPNVFVNSPTEGHGANAAKVEFYVDDDLVLMQTGDQAEYYVFKGFISGVAAGQHRVWARAYYTAPTLILDSVPVLINVAAPPSYGSTMDLAADVTASGSAYQIVGSTGARVRVNGNGHVLKGGGAGTQITLQHVDFFGMGSASATQNPGIQLLTGTGLVVEDCTFDGSNPLDFTVDGSATVSVAGNTFRSNMRQPIGQFPDSMNQSSYPVVTFHGSSTVAKSFRGNNVGAGWILFTTTQNWLVGGDNDGDANVLMGPRVGLYADRATAMQFRGNYSHHIYYGGWSQGSNFELGGGASMLAEHNVIIGSSWPVRGVGGEFRYNLVTDAGHEWLWATNDGAYVHHNVFLGGDDDVGGIFILYGPKNVRIQNNTIDGLAGPMFKTSVELDDGTVSLTSNLFLNAPKTAVTMTGGSLTADYNAFWRSTVPFYSDQRAPGHDTSLDPKLANPPTVTLDFDESMVWTRALGVREVLRSYRARYTPQAGSSVIDSGDPAGGAGNDIGAVGAGAANAADLFGR
jgi:hypothetical protein